MKHNNTPGVPACACGNPKRTGWTHRPGWCNEGGPAAFEAAEPQRCGSYECQAAQQDGVLCADGECDRASGVRPAGVKEGDRG